MRKAFHAKGSTAPRLAQKARSSKRTVRPDNEPGAKRYITLCENGKDFRIPISGPKGNFLWEEISDNLLREIIKERIKERGITTRSQLTKSKPYGARIEKKAKDRGILDEMLPVEAKPIKKKSKKTEDKDPNVGKPGPIDKEEYWKLRREVIKYWIEDTSWIDELGKDKKDG
jgi:hypothetical protein